jgi:hypothetical protein
MSAHTRLRRLKRNHAQDFGPWANGFKVPINDNWGRTVGAERIDGGILQEPAPYRLSFYAEASKQGDTLVPSTETLPGWSGANQIPLKVSGNKVRVNFKREALPIRVSAATALIRPACWPDFFLDGIASCKSSSH